ILVEGAALGRFLKGKLHIFHAYMPLPLIAPSPGMAIAIEMPPEIEEAHTKQVENAFDRLAERSQIPDVRRHLHMGLVIDELRAVVKRTRAKIVVMGAVSRSALRRAFIGNTAESVLD